MCNSRNITTEIEPLVVEDDILRSIRLLVGVGDGNSVVTMSDNETC